MVFQNSIHHFFSVLDSAREVSAPMFSRSKRPRRRLFGSLDYFSLEYYWDKTALGARRDRLRFRRTLPGYELETNHNRLFFCC